jgi:hypothetical protein
MSSVPETLRRLLEQQRHKTSALVLSITPRSAGFQPYSARSLYAYEERQVRAEQTRSLRGHCLSVP